VSDLTIERQIVRATCYRSATRPPGPPADADWRSGHRPLNLIDPQGAVPSTRWNRDGQGSSTPTRPSRPCSPFSIGKTCSRSCRRRTIGDAESLSDPVRSQPRQRAERLYTHDYGYAPGAPTTSSIATSTPVGLHRDLGPPSAPAATTGFSSRSTIPPPTSCNTMPTTHTRSLWMKAPTRSVWQPRFLHLEPDHQRLRAYQNLRALRLRRPPTT